MKQANNAHYTLNLGTIFILFFITQRFISVIKKLLVICYPKLNKYSMTHVEQKGVWKPNSNQINEMEKSIML